MTNISSTYMQPVCEVCMFLISETPLGFQMLMSLIAQTSKGVIYVCPSGPTQKGRRRMLSTT